MPRATSIWWRRNGDIAVELAQDTGLWAVVSWNPERQVFECSECKRVSLIHSCIHTDQALSHLPGLPVLTPEQAVVMSHARRDPMARIFFNEFEANRQAAFAEYQGSLDGVEPDKSNLAPATPLYNAQNRLHLLDSSPVSE